MKMTVPLSTLHGSEATGEGDGHEAAFSRPEQGQDQEQHPLQVVFTTRDPTGSSEEPTPFETAMVAMEAFAEPQRNPEEVLGEYQQEQTLDSRAAQSCTETFLGQSQEVRGYKERIRQLTRRRTTSLEKAKARRK